MPTLKSAKKSANASFSKYIRLKYADKDGHVKCYTCGVRKYWEKDGMQCGHGIPGRCNYLLYAEEICRPQCYGCNVMKRGALHIFTLKLVDEMGRERFEEWIKYQEVQYKVNDYVEMKKKYDKLAEVLR